MPRSRKLIFTVSLIFIVIACGFIFSPSPKKEKVKKFDQLVTISTMYGDMKVILYDETPLHKENFLKLVDEGFYDSTTFHRVMYEFMIQGGDPNSKDNNPNNDGLGGPGYTIDAEFNPKFYHRKGVIAAARQPDNVNPKKASSGSQFYIVHGRKFNANETNRMAAMKRIQYSPEQINAYSELGGAPHLDGDYTVFGEVISGMNIIDSIAQVKTSFGNRPVQNVIMKMTSEKIKRKKISKEYQYQYPALEPSKDSNE